MTDAVLLRLATDADTPALIDLKWAMNLAEHATFPAGSRVAPMLDLDRAAAARAVNERRAQMAEDGGGCWVAECDGAVVGSAYWTPMTLQPAFRRDAARVGLIGGVVVAEAFRGRGLGKLLMARVEREIAAAGLQYAFLEVVASNAPALALYGALGFEGFETAMLKPLGAPAEKGS